MWELALMAIIATGSLISTIYSNKKNEQNQDKILNWNEQMQDKQNEYNKPENQMQRLSDAGVNPLSTLMGNGMSVSGNTSAGVGTVSPIQFQDPFGALSSSMLQMMNARKSREEGTSIKSKRELEIEQIKAQNEQLLASAANLNASAESLRIANKYADMRELWAAANQRAVTFKTYADKAAAEAAYKKGVYELENLLPEQVKLTASQNKLNLNNVDEVLARIEDLKASAALKASQKSTSDAQTDLVNAQTKNVISDTKLNDQESKYYDELQEKYLTQLEANIRDLQAKADLDEQQAYFYAFDKADQYAPKVMGTTTDVSGARKRVKQAKLVFNHRTVNGAYGPN